MSCSCVRFCYNTEAAALSSSSNFFCSAALYAASNIFYSLCISINFFLPSISPWSSAKYCLYLFLSKIFLFNSPFAATSFYRANMAPHSSCKPFLFFGNSRTGESFTLGLADNLDPAFFSGGLSVAAPFNWLIWFFARD